MSSHYIHTRSLKKYLVKYNDELYLVPTFMQKDEIPLVINTLQPITIINDYIVEFIDLNE